MTRSVATTLGLTRVSAQTFRLVQEHAVFSEVVTDQEAVQAVERFIGECDPGPAPPPPPRRPLVTDLLPPDDEKILVEPACGAALAAVYSGVLKRLQREGKLPEEMAGPVVVVVCGGNNISIGQLQMLKKQLGLSSAGHEVGPA